MLSIASEVYNRNFPLSCRPDVGVAVHLMLPPMDFETLFSMTFSILFL